MNIRNIQKTIEKLQKEIVAQKQKSHQYSMIRLALLIVFGGGFYTGYQKEVVWGYGISIIAFLVFFLVVRQHGVLRQQLEDSELLCIAYEDILKRKNNEWKHFIDDGREFLQEQDTQAYDLDLLGKASLFQYLSVAKTYEGRQALAEALRCQSHTAQDILERQHAVAECVEKETVTMHLIQLLKLFDKHSRKRKHRQLEAFYASLKEPIKEQPLMMKLASFGLPCITWLGIIGMAFLGKSYLLFSIGFTISLCFSLLFTMRNGEELATVGKMQELMKDYHRILNVLQESSFHSSYLLGLQEETKDALKGIQRLHVLLGFVQARNNFILNILLNGCFLLDFHCARSYGSWRSAYGVQVEDWLKAVAKLEVILSLVQLSYAKDSCIFPTLIETQELSFSMEAMHHPLLNEQEAVKNSFSATAGSYIITGSNMSGKTTFLRTIGVNMALLQAGAMVCANACTSSLLQMYTSMRIQDDVSEGISTFYAEILRIKEMMDASTNKQPMLVLIDEIFKGTNSADRIQCAIQAIRRLHQPWIITMVSTHDFELCDLEQEPDIQARNYHFSEYYEENRICFDYTLKDGRCQTTNAKQLMKLAGFWEE